LFVVSGLSGALASAAEPFVDDAARRVEFPAVVMRVCLAGHSAITSE